MIGKEWFLMSAPRLIKYSPQSQPCQHHTESAESPIKDPSICLSSLGMCFRIQRVTEAKSPYSAKSPRNFNNMTINEFGILKKTNWNQPLSAVYRELCQNYQQTSFIIYHRQVLYIWLYLLYSNIPKIIPPRGKIPFILVQSREREVRYSIQSVDFPRRDPKIKPANKLGEEWDPSNFWGQKVNLHQQDHQGSKAFVYMPTKPKGSSLVKTTFWWLQLRPGTPPVASFTQNGEPYKRYSTQQASEKDRERRLDKTRLLLDYSLYKNGRETWGALRSRSIKCGELYKMAVIY